MPMKTAPIATGTNEIASHRRHLPTKSNFQRGSRTSSPSTFGSENAFVPEMPSMIRRVTTTAVKNDSSTPTISVKAKPFGPAVLNRNSTAAVRNVTTLASMIALRPLVYPVSSADFVLRPARVSSRMRSKMTTLASEATPMVRMTPAMPGSVRVIGTATMTAAKNRAYISRAPAAMRPSNLKYAMRNRTTRTRPITPAISPCCSDSAPSVADTCFWLITSRRIGMAPEFSWSASVRAVSVVKLPEICAPLLPLMPFGYWR